MVPIQTKLGIVKQLFCSAKQVQSNLDQLKAYFHFAEMQKASLALAPLQVSTAVHAEAV